jgi:hypothetical protein
MHYETPRTPTDKQWTDQSLLSTRSVNSYLAESEAFQRNSFANIIEKWKKHDRNKTTQLISSFDDRYNMKIRFRQDDQLNRSSEMKYASIADYYRFLGDESNPKNAKPCVRHKRRTQEYEERHVRDLLKLPTTVKSRSQPYFLPKITNSSGHGIGLNNSLSIRSSLFASEVSHHTDS